MEFSLNNIQDTSNVDVNAKILKVGNQNVHFDSYSETCLLWLPLGPDLIKHVQMAIHYTGYFVCKIHILHWKKN